MVVAVTVTLVVVVAVTPIVTVVVIRMVAVVVTCAHVWRPFLYADFLYADGAPHCVRTKPLPPRGRLHAHAPHLRILRIRRGTRKGTEREEARNAKRH